jgi:hypothetical protein
LGLEYTTASRDFLEVDYWKESRSEHIGAFTQARGYPGDRLATRC